MAGGSEILIVVALAVLLFGAGWLPKAARNLGKAKVEMDKAQQQFNEAKDSVVEASGVKELESTMRKANKALNTSPQKLLKDAAKSSVVGPAAKQATTAAETDTAETDTSDPQIEDAEIVEPPASQGDTTSDTTKNGDTTKGDTNINLDFR